jgi:hypothetical protein
MVAWGAFVKRLAWALAIIRLTGKDAESYLRCREATVLVPNVLAEPISEGHGGGVWQRLTFKFPN